MDLNNGVVGIVFAGEQSLHLETVYIDRKLLKSFVRLCRKIFIAFFLSQFQQYLKIFERLSQPFELCKVIFLLFLFFQHTLSRLLIIPEIRRHALFI